MSLDKNKNQTEPVNSESLSSYLADGDAGFRKLMHALPEETVSLRWRSALNERLLSLQPLKRKLSLAAVGLRAMFGVALASAICLLVVSRVSTHKQAHPGSLDANALASALIFEHSQSVISGEIAGPGIADGDSDRDQQGAADSEDADSDTL